MTASCIHKQIRVFFVGLLRGVTEALPMLLLLVLLPAAGSAQTFSVASKGDYGNVTVIEVSGNYDALKSDGTQNTTPRSLIMTEFYKTHKDEYDFVVLFTNFNFTMPQPGAKAFYTGVKNDTQGIGTAQFDSTAQYGSSGKLQGIIEMGNISGLASDPTTTAFEDTLALLTHQFMHRWGANVSFHESSGATSAALVSSDGNRHWSYLLDTNGSALYGNHWRDNGDGSFTSIEPDSGALSGSGRIFSPLDLYLMGLSGPELVPDLLLIENPAIDGSQLPAAMGMVISGAAKHISINDIIATEGARVPGAAASQKTFKTAFIYVSAPGSFPDTGLLGIENIRNGWVSRYSVLTNGKAIMQVTPLPLDGTLPVNPCVSVPIITPRTVPPDINQGLAWLLGRQQVDGHWEDLPFTALRDTAETLMALKYFSSAQQNYLNGLAWLSAASSGNTDYTARAVLALAASGRDVSLLTGRLVSDQNADGGWGSRKNFMSDPADSGLALASLSSAGYADSTVISKALGYLSLSQNADGGWSSALDQGSGIQPTATVLTALKAFRGAYQLESSITSGIAWLVQKQNADGGFGIIGSTVYDTAAALLALRETGVSQTILNKGIVYLNNSQSATGSWNESAYQTALAVQALWLVSVDPDLVVVSSGITLTPSTVTSIPANIVITASIWNIGNTTVPQAVVGLYDGDPASGTKVSEQVVSFPNQAATSVAFSAMVNDHFDHTYFISVDPANVINETNEANNVAWKTLAVNVPPIVTVSSPAAGTIYTSTPLLTYSVSYGDVTVKVDNVVVGKVSGQNLYPLVNGQHTVRVEASDGVKSGFAEVSFTVDVSPPPVVSLKSPVAGIYSDNAPLLLYDVSKTSTIVVKVDGIAANKLSGVRLDALSNGEHKVRVEATDPVGGFGFAEITFVVSTATETAYKIEQTRSSISPGSSGAIALDKMENVYIFGPNRMEKYDSTLQQRYWFADVTGSFDTNHPQHISVNSDGDVYLAAYSSSGLYGYTPKGSQDAYSIKYDTNGNYLSAMQMASIYTDEAFGTVVDNDDSMYVCGLTGGSLFNSNSGYWNLFLAKYDKQHNVVWGRQVSTKSNTSLGALFYCDVTVDGNGYVYALALTDGDPDGYMLVKYDSAGVLQWRKPAGIHTGSTSGGTFAYSVAADALGNMYVAGSTLDALDGNVNSGIYDIFVVKYNSAGTREWTKQWGTSSDEAAYEVIAEGNGTLYVTGKGSLPGAVGSGNIFLRKCDTNGNIIWTEQLNGSAGYGLALGSSGSLYLVGTGSNLTMYKLHDTRRPSVALDRQTAWTNTESAIISGTMTAGAAVDVTADTAAVAGLVTYPTSATWQCTITGLSEGTNTITATARNSGGFWSTASGQVIRDSVVPIVSITAPGNGQTYYDKPVLEYTVSDGYVKVKINGIEVYKQSGHTLDSLSAGENVIRVEATDEAGNTGFDEITIIASGVAAGELPYAPAWQRQVGSTGNEIVTDAARDGAGNVYVTGYTSSALDTNTNYGGTDIFVVKYDASGNKAGKAWQIGTSSSESNSRIAVDASGNVYLAWEITYASPKNGNYSDVQLAKYDATGKQVWLQTLGASKAFDYLGDIGIDSAGNVYVGGSTLGAIGTHTYGGGYDYFLAQYSSAGRQKWLVQSGLSGNEQINAIALDQSGNIYITGQIGTNAFVHKYNTAGTAQWTAPVLIDQQHQGYGSAMAIDASGNAVVTGSMDLGAGGLYDLFIAKYNSLGTAAWPVQYLGSGSNDYGKAIAIDTAGSIFVTGYTGAAFDGNRQAGANDVFLVKFSAGGQKAWSQQMGSSADDIPAAVITDGSGGLSVAGYTYGDISGSTASGADVFLIKLQKQ